MSANGIAQLSTKEAKQKAKLDIAQAKRQGKTVAADGTISGSMDPTQPYYRFLNTYNITELPTQYSGNSLVDNPNSDGLLLGRPWAPDHAGLYRTTYSGYFADNVSWFATASVTGAGADTSLAIPSVGANTSYQYVGYFRPATTETYTFYSNSDDASYIWVGRYAEIGFTTSNALVNDGGTHGDTEVSGSIDLQAGIYYAFRIQYGNGGGPGDLTIAYSTPTITKTNSWTNLIWYNSANNGL